MWNSKFKIRFFFFPSDTPCKYSRRVQCLTRPNVILKIKILSFYTCVDAVQLKKPDTHTMAPRASLPPLYGPGKSITECIWVTGWLTTFFYLYAECDRKKKPILSGAFKPKKVSRGQTVGELRKKKNVSSRVYSGRL